MSFEIVSAFELGLNIFLAYSIYKLQKPTITKLGQGVRS